MLALFLSSLDQVQVNAPQPEVRRNRLHQLARIRASLGAVAESVLLGLDLEQIAAASGSACASGTSEPSHVLLAMGLDEEAARSGLRLSVGRDTSEADVDRAVDILIKTTESTRAT